MLKYKLAHIIDETLYIVFCVISLGSHLNLKVKVFKDVLILNFWSISAIEIMFDEQQDIPHNIKAMC